VNVLFGKTRVSARNFPAQFQQAVDDVANRHQPFEVQLAADEQEDRFVYDIEFFGRNEKKETVSKGKGRYIPTAGEITFDSADKQYESKLVASMVAQLYQMNIPPNQVKVTVFKKADPSDS
jgi:hypothetical protein